MDCRTFEQALQDELDGLPISPIVAEHAASCPSCEALAARYRGLAGAIRAGSPPSPPAGLADRVLAAYERGPSAPRIAGRVDWRGSRWARWMAAAVVLAAGLGVWRLSTPRALLEIRPRNELVRIEAHGLSKSLARATSATIRLAEETSAPAARLGRLLLASASVPESGAAETSRGDGFLRSVPGRVASGVEPLSGAARRAFGFLLPSAASGDDPASTRDPAAIHGESPRRGA